MNQPKKNEQAVAKKESSAVAAPVLDLALVAQDAGQGLSEINMDTIQIPFLKILSSMSPQTKKQKKEYIEGAEEGMIFNTVTEELIDGAEGITVVPCYFEPVALEWTDRGTVLPLLLHNTLWTLRSGITPKKMSWVKLGFQRQALI